MSKNLQIRGAGLSARRRMCSYDDEREGPRNEVDEIFGRALFQPECAVAYLLNKGGGLERDLRRELGCGFEGGYRFCAVSH